LKSQASQPLYLRVLSDETCGSGLFVAIQVLVQKVQGFVGADFGRHFSLSMFFFTAAYTTGY
jgi:hypothetical protein